MMMRRKGRRRWLRDGDGDRDDEEEEGDGEEEDDSMMVTRTLKTRMFCQPILRRPMPTVVLPREGQAASSFTLTNSAPGCTIERGRLAQSTVLKETQMYLPLETLLYQLCTCTCQRKDAFQVRE